MRRRQILRHLRHGVEKAAGAGDTSVDDYLTTSALSKEFDMAG